MCCRACKNKVPLPANDPLLLVPPPQAISSLSSISLTVHQTRQAPNYMRKGPHGLLLLHLIWVMGFLRLAVSWLHVTAMIPSWTLEKQYVWVWSSRQKTGLKNWRMYKFQDKRQQPCQMGPYNSVSGSSTQKAFPNFCWYLGSWQLSAGLCYDSCPWIRMAVVSKWLMD